MPSAPKLNLEVAVISLYDGVRVGDGFQPQVSHLVTKTPLVPAKSDRPECKAVFVVLSWLSALLRLRYPRDVPLGSWQSVPFLFGFITVHDVGAAE